jgi:hypothetical protein
MRKAVPFLAIALLVCVQMMFAQDPVRKVVSVPKVDAAAITIDGKMDEPAWATAAHADLVTATGFEIWASKYYRGGIPEPEFDELYGRMLWSQDTLYLFMHIKEFVNDSTNLFFGGNGYKATGGASTHWGGDQLYIGLSNSFGKAAIEGWEGAPWTAPDGPYMLMVMGNQVTLNDNDTVWIPEEFRKVFADSQKVFHASDFVRSAVTIDTLTGLWDVELAIYSPSVTDQSSIGFNIGGSTGSTAAYAAFGDAYGYYTWQPNIPGDPWGDVTHQNWNSWYVQQDSKYWAVLKFEPGVTDTIVRKQVDVPFVATGTITIDAVMDEPAWGTAAHADLVTGSGFEIWASKYYRGGIPEPEFDDLYGRMLWTNDTLYVFMHIKEFVNDSTNLFFGGNGYKATGGASTHWGGDQLYIGLSNRLARAAIEGWEGSPWNLPGGPAMMMVMGNQVTYNDNDTVWIPEEFRVVPTDSQKVFHASDYMRSATKIDTLTGLWDVELAIYHPNVASQAALGFNIGGSMGSTAAYAAFGDAYGYYTWQPNIPGDPWGDVTHQNWNSWYVQQDSKYWALLNFTGNTVGVGEPGVRAAIPSAFELSQNYPNPFNPSTKIAYALPRTAKVTLMVFNVLGQKIATLVNEQMNAGQHEVTWTAGNIGSGVYFFQLKADDKTVATKKMMLLK